MTSSTDRRMKRRRLLKFGLAGVGLAAVGGGGFVTYQMISAKVDTVGSVDFTNPLRIPDLEPGQVDDSGTRIFDLHMAPGESRIKPGSPTRTWGFNGDHLGPTLRARRGEVVRVNVRNSLPETSSVHWHGMHLPAIMDGGPHQSVEPLDTWTPEWTIDQPAATLWYHPHPHGSTAKHVYQGLAGLFILDDDEVDNLDLPDEYGVDDIPLIIQDRAFDGDNQLDDAANLFSGIGVLGDEILVNGTHSPYLDVTTRRVRLRLLNGSNARVFNFGFADDRPFVVIGSDGGLLPAPHSLRRLQLSPGERAELLVDFTPGETVVLRSYSPDLRTDFFESRSHGGDDTFDILQFRAADTLTDVESIPDELVPVPAIDIEQAVTTRTFEMAGYSLNRETMDMNRIDFAVNKDDIEIWEIENQDASVHNFHVHDVQFQVLSIGDQPPPPHEAGWKDTVQVYHGSPVRIALQFKDFSDPNMPYMCHCHILYHEDQGLMAQFVVLDEGEDIGSVPSGHDDHHG
ncbi:multicopper oxidase family protein [Stackebrandtia endophytica]|nr:multicopper oxidase domain-containing protein [Stackebrandtia endophytica]